jgi:hypothetical protein
MSAKPQPTPPVPSPADLSQVPAYAAALLMTASANAFSQSAINAVQAQQAGQIAMNAATAAGVARILGLTKAEETSFFDALQGDGAKA